MRSPSWRLFIACLLLLVLPLQGFAAVTALGCHGEPARSVPVKLLAAEVPTDAHAHHHGQMADPANATDATPTARAVDAAHGVGKTDKCSSCSPCCAGALVNTVSAPCIAAAPAGGMFPDPSSWNPSPTLAGLDRPPRQVTL